MAYQQYGPTGAQYNYTGGFPGVESYYNVSSMGQGNWYSTPRTVDPTTIMSPAFSPFDGSDGSPISYGRRSNGSISSMSSAGFEGLDSTSTRVQQRPRSPGRHSSSSDKREKIPRHQPSRDDEVVTTAKANKYFCDQPECQENGRRSSFTRNADLKRHAETVHGRPRINCHFKGCPRKGENGFSRNDHYNAHLRSYHHEDIPLRNSRS